MLDKLPLTNVLFIDIETVCGERDLTKMKPSLLGAWQIKASQLLKIKPDELKEEESNQLFKDKAAFYAEFGKIICISVGLIIRKGKESDLSVKLNSYYGDDEAALLRAFSEMMSQYFNDPNKHYICGHNIKEFDIPFICRRMVINGLDLPNLLSIQGRKPWETAYLLDTMTLWRFGAFKSYASLKLLTAVFDIPSPKDDIDGSEVGKVYWEDEELARIVKYCEKDVLAVIQLMMKFKRLSLFDKSNIISVTKY